MTCWPEGGPGLEPGTDMFGIAGTAELSTFCPGTGTWNRLQDGMLTATVQGIFDRLTKCHSNGLPLLIA